MRPDLLIVQTLTVTSAEDRGEVRCVVTVYVSYNYVYEVRDEVAKHKSPELSSAF